ncbi:MAG: YacL family protein [Motiliproteus sp.]
MDYKFRTDLLGRHVAQFTMGHEAIGNWLTSDLSNNAERIAAVFAAIHQIQNKESSSLELEGPEYALQLSLEEAVVSAHSLSAVADESDPVMADGLNYYDSESRAECGLDDFIELLAAWTQFVGGADSHLCHST